MGYIVHGVSLGLLHQPMEREFLMLILGLLDSPWLLGEVLLLAYISLGVKQSFSCCFSGNH